MNAYREDFFEKHSQFRDLTWKNLTKLACKMESFQISMKHAYFFFKFFMQIIDITHQKLLSHFCYALLHRYKVVLAICELSTNSQKKQQTVD